MKITFLFGAGAEGKGQINLPSGVDFKSDIICSQNVAGFANKLLPAGADEMSIKDGTILLPNSSDTLYQTIVETRDKPESLEELFPDEADKNLAEQYVEFREGKLRWQPRETRPFQGTDRDYFFSNLYWEKFYSLIKNNKLTDSSVQFFLKNAGFYSFLDSNFNYLRNPELYKNECKRVIKIYYSALKSILDGLIDFIDKDPDATEEAKELVQRYKNFCDSAIETDNPRNELAQIIGEIENKTCEIAGSDSKKNIYYQEIRNLLNDQNKGVEINCVTANYTTIAKKILGLDEEHFASIHGRLSLFEELDSKTIDFLPQLSGESVVFPYILVQSGIKPIISPLQIEEFHKAKTYFENSDIVIILGYGVNSDDEHITNLIRWRQHLNKEIVYFVHAKDDADFTNKRKHVCDQIGSDVFITFKSTDDFLKYIESF